MPQPFTPSNEEAFQQALQGEDELGLVIRSHIHIEANLLALLDALLASSRHADKMNLEYSQRVHLAVALGLLPEYEAPLLAFGTLRNAFAHRPGTRLSKDRVNSLYACLSPKLKTLVRESHERARRKPGHEAALPYNRLSPRDQIVFIAITLHALLEVAIKHAKATQ